MTKNIERRLNFLLELAKNEKKRDQVSTFLMRVISNHATIGMDAGSAKIKTLNKTISKEAYKLLLSTNIKTFCKNTINEHPRPLKTTWEWLQEKADSLSIEEVWNEFKKHQMITITKEEDAKIKFSGQNSTGSFKSRYTDLGIEVILLKKSPFEISKTAL
jgi:hypothetical protein